jgi:beta-glucosidase
MVGFTRVTLAPGEAKSVAVALNDLCESIYDTGKHAFVRLPGTYTILAGSSSADTPLKATFRVP